MTARPISPGWTLRGVPEQVVAKCAANARLKGIPIGQYVGMLLEEVLREENDVVAFVDYRRETEDRISQLEEQLRKLDDTAKVRYLALDERLTALESDATPPKKRARRSTSGRIKGPGIGTW
ncbi:MAG: hypothetical protein ACRC67_12125 [Inquilinus sp.]|uniref:hypothetical protein n=1 Tax=Inquilinus sp. TaxID=1932117 RepID=UPI003F302527